MLNVESIQNGIVIDHIPAGKGMDIYRLLELESKTQSVALLQSVKSQKYGCKDLIKIEGETLPERLDVLGYLDSQITLIVIRDGKVVKKYHPVPPQKLVNVIKCKNPRCITSIETNCDHIFELSPSGRYRCLYCNQEMPVGTKGMRITMQRKLHGQMSESFLIAGILSVSGGLQDAYTYMYRGKVFANAQTGNIVLLAQNLVDRNWQAALRYFSPLLFFALGVAMAECIRMRYQKAQKIHWRQLVLVTEIVLLFAVGFFPNDIDLLANAMVSFACAMQVQAFRKVNGYAFASTMCIGNLRSGMESLCAYGKTKDKKILRKSGYYFGIIFLFAVGAALGGHMIGYIGAKTIWISCTILLISFLCMFIKEEKEEHPEIMEEEQEIRDNLKNIRKEARDVEHILEDDIRSQIEKK